MSVEMWKESIGFISQWAAMPGGNRRRFALGWVPCGSQRPLNILAATIGYREEDDRKGGDAIGEPGTASLLSNRYIREDAVTSDQPNDATSPANPGA